MGHKAHPVGLRLGIHRKWKSNWYFDSKNYTQFLHLNFDIEKYFKGLLYFYPRKTLLINCQIIKLPSNQIFIFIFFYRLRQKFKKLKNNLWKTKRWKTNLKKTLINKGKDNFSNLFINNQNNKYYLDFVVNNFYKNKDNITNNLNCSKIIINNKIEYPNINNFYKTYKNYLYMNLLIKKLKNKKSIFLLKVLIKIKYLKFLNKMLFLNNNNNILIKKWIKDLTHIVNKKKNKYNNLNFLYILNKNYENFNFYLLKKQQFNLNKIELNSKEILLKKKKIKVLLSFQKLKRKKLRRNKKVLTKKNYKIFFSNIKKFLTLITNSKINLIFINGLSFCKFYYYTQKKIKNKFQINERFNIWPLQRFLFNRYKYTAIYIKDFIHLSFIAVLIKNPQIIVNFIGRQFKHLPKNRKQLKLLSFVTQTLKIICEQRQEIIGFKFQLTGRLNRRTRTKTYNFKKGTLPIQTHITRVEYAYSKGFTRSGIIGLKLWIFYNKVFKNKLKKKFLEYFLYSKYKLKFNYNLFVKKYLYATKKITRKTWKDKMLDQKIQQFFKNLDNAKTKSTQI